MATMVFPLVCGLFAPARQVQGDRVEVLSSEEGSCGDAYLRTCEEGREGKWGGGRATRLGGVLREGEGGRVRRRAGYCTQKAFVTIFRFIAVSSPFFVLFLAQWKRLYSRHVLKIQALGCLEMRMEPEIV